MKKTRNSYFLKLTLFFTGSITRIRSSILLLLFLQLQILSGQTLDPNNLLRITLEEPSSGKKGVTTLYLEENSTFNFDQNYDALFTYSYQSVDLVSMSKENFELTINAFPEAKIDDTIRLKAYTEIPGTYTFHFKGNFFEKSMSYENVKEAYLWDKLLNIYTNIEEGNTYSFEAKEDEKIQGDRFKIVFDKAVTALDFLNNFFTLSPNPCTNNYFEINLPKEVNIEEINIFDLLGHAYQIDYINRKNNKLLITSQLVSGQYIVLINYNGTTIAKRLIIEN